MNYIKEVPRIRKCLQCGNWHHKDTLIEVEVGPEKEAWVCRDCLDYIDTRKKIFIREQINKNAPKEGN